MVESFIALIIAQLSKPNFALQEISTQGENSSQNLQTHFNLKLIRRGGAVKTNFVVTVIVSTKLALNLSTVSCLQILTSL